MSREKQWKKGKKEEKKTKISKFSATRTYLKLKFFSFFFFFYFWTFPLAQCSKTCFSNGILFLAVQAYLCYVASFSLRLSLLKDVTVVNRTCKGRLAPGNKSSNTNAKFILKISFQKPLHNIGIANLANIPINSFHMSKLDLPMLAVGFSSLQARLHST